MPALGPLLRRVASALLMLTAAQMSVASAYAAGPGQPTPRAAMIAAASRVVGSAPGLAKLWPGYWPTTQPFIIYVPSQGALLVSQGERPASFQPLDVAEAGGRLKGRAFWHGGPMADVQQPFVTGYPIGSGKTAILANAAEVDADRIISTLLHEQFHVYQARAFKAFGFSEYVDPAGIPDPVAFAASAETERRILAKAVAAAAPAEARALLQQYLALRHAREAGMSAQAVAVERSLERIEGTARYVDRLGLATIDGGPSRLRSLLVTELQRPLASQPGGFETNWFRLRSYGTGGAITYLLSQLDAGSFRARIESGADPAELLEALVPSPSPADAANLASTARESFGYAAILREIAPLIRSADAAEVKTAEAFLAGAPYRLVLDATVIVDSNAGWDGDMVQLGPLAVAIPKAKTFSYTAPSVSVAARGLPVLMEGERYTFVLAAPPRVAGLDPSASGEHRLPSVTIRADGFDLKIDRPVAVTLSKSSMIVRPGPR